MIAQWTMTSLAVLFSNQIKLNISKGKAVYQKRQTLYQKSYAVILTDLFNAIKNS